MNDFLTVLGADGVRRPENDELWEKLKNESQLRGSEMTTEYKLNTLIEWTDEDRAKGECPVPIGSEVTLWLEDGGASRTVMVTAYDWGDCVLGEPIIAYLIHSVPREPIVRWMVVGGLFDSYCYSTEKNAKQALSGDGRVVKLVEEM